MRLDKMEMGACRTFDLGYSTAIMVLFLLFTIIIAPHTVAAGEEQSKSPKVSPTPADDAEFCPEDLPRQSDQKVKEQPASSGARVVSPLDKVWDPETMRQKGVIGNTFSRYRGEADYDGGKATITSAPAPRAPSQPVTKTRAPTASSGIKAPRRG